MMQCLGNIEEIKTRIGDAEPIEWAKEETNNLPKLIKNRNVEFLSNIPLLGLLIKMFVVQQLLVIFFFNIITTLFYLIKSVQKYR